MNPSFKVKIQSGGINMGKKNAVRKNSNHFTPNHIGTKSRGFGGNKGKQMQDQSGQHAQVMQTKGE